MESQYVLLCAIQRDALTLKVTGASICSNSILRRYQASVICCGVSDLVNKAMVVEKLEA